MTSTGRVQCAALDTVLAARTALVSDVLVALGHDDFVIEGVSALRGKTTMAGRAITVQLSKAQPGRPFHKAPFIHSGIIGQAAAGDVIVMAAGGAPYAFWGDHMVEKALARGVAGAVLDGKVRDADLLAEMDLPIFSLGATPISLLTFYEAVAADVDIVCGGASVCPGDIVIGDGDGVLVVPVSLVGAVAQGLQVMEEIEDWVGRAMGEGRPMREVYGEVHSRMEAIRRFAPDA